MEVTDCATSLSVLRLLPIAASGGLPSDDLDMIESFLDCGAGASSPTGCSESTPSLTCRNKVKPKGQIFGFCHLSKNCKCRSTFI